MGYYTTYKLSVKDLYNNHGYEKQVEHELQKHFTFLDKELEVYDVKWYRHEEELKQFTTEYLNILLTVTGIGEEYYFEGTKLIADIWIKYFLNGKSYCDKLDYNFPKVDLNKLK